MRIKSCEIKSFGKLQDKTIELDNGITVIRGKNESGKSTLSSFIKYALYGFAGKGRDEKGNEKIRYSPWSGFKCSGALVLENSKGETYRVERSSESRSASSRITDISGNVCFDGIEAGEALYGIDMSTFAKSAYVGQNDIETGGVKDLGAGIEKLLLDSGENDVDFDKAQKKLTAERNILYNRMRSTGLIFELSQKISELKERKRILTNDHNALINAEFSAEETKKRIAENSEHLEKLYAERENIAAYEADELLCKINAAKEKCEKSETEYLLLRRKAERNGVVPDRKYLDELSKAFSDCLASSPGLLRAENDLAEAEKEYNVLTARLYEGNRFPAETENDPTTVMSVLEEAHLLYGKQKKYRKAAVILLCCVVTFPAAIVMFILARKKKKALDDLLAKYGFSDITELEDYSELYKNTIALMYQNRKETEKKKKIFEERKEEAAVYEDLLSKMLSVIGFERGRLSDEMFFDEIKDRLLPELRHEVEMLEKANSVYISDENAYNALVSVSDMAKLAELVSHKKELPPVGTSDEVERAIKYDEGANRMLSVKLSEFNVEIARLRASICDPAELESELLTLEKELEEAKLNNEAIELAMKMITDSRESIRGNVLPEISERASELFSHFTGGKYRSLLFDKDFAVKVLETNDPEMRRIGFLSTGAADTAYLALRIALTEFMCREKPTFIFDDSFVKLDDERLENILKVLVSLSEEYQIVILSCVDREERFLREKCKVVVLDEK